MNASFSGEFRAVVTAASGEVVSDTGYQDNLILDQGLDFFGGLHGGNTLSSSINAFCVIGTGNSTPVVTQTTLDSAVEIVRGTGTTQNFSVPVGEDGMYRVWEQKKYTFTGLGAVNISELGLASRGTISDYSLMTRALTKDYLDTPKPIAVADGDTLDIYYKFHKITNVNANPATVVNVTDGRGASVPYNVELKATSVGKSSPTNTVTNPLAIAPFYTAGQFNWIYFSKVELRSINDSSDISGSQKSKPTILSLGEYTPKTFKRNVFINLGIEDGNIPEGIRSVHMIIGGTSADSPTPIPLLPVQMRFGSVADDSTLKKNNSLEIIIPVEYSWGRSE